MILTIKDTDYEAHRELLDHYGVMANTAKAAEEAAELAAALNRIIFGSTCSTLRAVAGEIADFQNMTERLFMAYPGLASLVEEIKPKKLARALDRARMEKIG